MTRPTAWRARPSSASDRAAPWTASCGSSAAAALTIADPRAIRQWPSIQPGPVRIENASADDRRFEAGEPLEVPAGAKRVGIDYTAVALTQPNRVRFRYRLDGFDTEWILAGTRRSAVYTNLPPRSYRFLVEASTDEDGWTGSSSATVTFTVLPAFYQTGWFYGLCVLVAGAVVIGAWRLRVGMVRREYSAVLAERARLSREIHDTLLQSLVGVALQMDHLAHGVCAASAEAKETLLRTGRRVEAYVREARQSILDLRSPVLDTVGLPEALRQIGKDITAESNLGFSLTVTGRPRRCAARLENELLRIGQEADHQRRPPRAGEPDPPRSPLRRRRGGAEGAGRRARVHAVGGPPRGRPALRARQHARAGREPGRPVHDRPIGVRRHRGGGGGADVGGRMTLARLR